MKQCKLVIALSTAILLILTGAAYFNSFFSTNKNETITLNVPITKDNASVIHREDVLETVSRNLPPLNIFQYANNKSYEKNGSNTDPSPKTINKLHTQTIEDGSKTQHHTKINSDDNSSNTDIYYDYDLDLAEYDEATITGLDCINFFKDPEVDYYEGENLSDEIKQYLHQIYPRNMAYIGKKDGNNGMKRLRYYERKFEICYRKLMQGLKNAKKLSSLPFEILQVLYERYEEEKKKYGEMKMKNADQTLVD